MKKVKGKKVKSEITKMMTMRSFLSRVRYDILSVFPKKEVFVIVMVQSGERIN